MCHNNTKALKWQDDPRNSHYLTGLTGINQAGTIRADQFVFSCVDEAKTISASDASRRLNQLAFGLAIFNRALSRFGLLL